ENLSFEVMNAEELTFNHSSIDIICGSGILHHLELEKAIKSIVNVLKPSGTAIFIEPLGHNVLINLFRILTPSIRSEDEHPLLESDLNLIGRNFKKVEIKYFYLTALAATLMVGIPGFKVMLNVLEFLDKLLFKLPFLKKQAWQVLIKLSEPLKD
ncbi:MAG: class I SAM-dependent methyltransferase, partial [Dolichospermum sp.]